MYEDKKWFSQTLMYYEDHIYQTDGKLRVAISTNTGDDINFNPPQFNISISHNYQKACNLNIQQAYDLFNSFKEVLKIAENEDVEVLRRISKNVELSVKFKSDQQNNAVVEMSLRSSSTDFTKIIIPVEIFSVFAHRLKNFVNSYDDICYRLFTKNIQAENMNILKQLPSLIRGISSQIISNNYTDTGASARQEEPPEEVASQSTIEELDKFLGQNLENVKVPEIDNEQIKVEEKSVTEIHSDFVETILENKLSNLENMLINLDNSNSPVIDLNDDLTNRIGRDDLESTFLPGITEDELKSTVYVSKLLCTLITKAHVKFNSAIPTSTPILKYKVREYKDENLELAYDLVTFFAYMRTMRNRMSDKSSDFIVNKARFYLQMRSYMDVFCFSFLEKVDKTKLISIVNNRFKYFDSIGVFDEYKETLRKYNCPLVSEYDVEAFVTEACDKIIGKSMYILEQHDNLIKSNSFRMPTSNNFTLEQITNEIVPLEADEKMGVDIKTTNYASAEIMNWFIGNKEPKVKKVQTEKSSNIIRFATHYRNEIPEQYREDFLTWLKAVEDMNFTFDDCEFPIAEFGSNIVKGLYLWKPQDDEKLTKSYKYFWSKFEDCMLDKSHILALDEKPEDKKSEEWSEAFDTITFE